MTAWSKLHVSYSFAVQSNETERCVYTAIQVQATMHQLPIWDVRCRLKHSCQVVKCLHDSRLPVFL